MFLFFTIFLFARYNPFSSHTFPPKKTPNDDIKGFFQNRKRRAQKKIEVDMFAFHELPRQSGLSGSTV